MTEEDRDSIRHLGVMIEGLRSETQLVAEGVAMNNERLARFEEKTEGEFRAIRADMARGFAGLRAEGDAFRAEVASEFKAVRTEMASEFTAVRTEMASGFADVRALAPPG